MKITGEQFIQNILKNPSWAKNLKNPVEVTTPIDLSGIKITHLSPLLTFSGRNADGYSASFTGADIDVACGTFHGAVLFDWAKIKEIKDLSIKEPSKNGVAARFHGCENLRCATGTFPGYVDFDNSGVKEMKDLVVTGVDNDGVSASFYECKYLDVATGQFNGAIHLSRSSIKKIEKLSIKNPDKSGIAIYLNNCIKIKELRGKYPGGVCAAESSLEHIEITIAPPPKVWLPYLLDIRKVKSLKTISKLLDPRRKDNDINNGLVLACDQCIESLQNYEKIKKAVEKRLDKGTISI